MKASEKWCVECGAENRPTLAVGVNEDGDPSCAMHFRSSNSVVHQPEKSTAMSEDKTGRKCPGFEKECNAIIGPRKELCTSCYARRAYRQRQGGQSVKTATRTKNATPSPLAELKADLQRKLAALELVESLLEA